MSEPVTPVNYWRKCTTCKKPVHFGQKYWICSVSTCNRQRTDLVFCDLRCFDAHVPVLNHRDAGAFERKAPLQRERLAEEKGPTSSSALAPKTTASQNPPPPSRAAQVRPSSSSEAQEVLIVVSKMKAYIRSCSGMNTSDSVAALLTQKVIRMADQAIEQAKKSGRQTVMDRDIL